MKKFLLLFFLAATVLVSCKKDSYNASTQAAKDDAAIQAWLTANNITAVKDTLGLYYSVRVAGTGTTYPNANSVIKVSYKGMLLDGTVFDSNTNFSSSMHDVIQGWQIGLKHITTGGRILLFVPSALGYGNTATGSIPKNSVLIFTIDLLGIE